MRRAIVLCQGEQARLASLGYPKQLLPIGPETILDRTLRLLAEAEWPAVVIGREVDFSEICNRHGTPLRQLAVPGYCVLDAMAQLGDLSADDTRVLLGDVVWSRAALTSFLQEGRPVFFAGQPNISPGEGELFGMGFSSAAQPHVAASLGAVPCRRVLVDRGQPGHLRNLLFFLSDRERPFPPSLHYAPRFLLPISDWTTDIDTPEQLRRVAGLIAAIAKEG